jgi:hypothetical protein
MNKNEKNNNKLIDLLVAMLEQSMRWSDEHIHHLNVRRVSWRELMEERRKVKYLKKIIERYAPHKSVSDAELTRIVNRFAVDKDDDDRLVH